jgi:hypothetical protein
MATSESTDIQKNLKELDQIIKKMKDDLKKNISEEFINKFKNILNKNNDKNKIIGETKELIEKLLTININLNDQITSLKKLFKNALNDLNDKNIELKRLFEIFLNISGDEEDKYLEKIKDLLNNYSEKLLTIIKSEKKTEIVKKMVLFDLFDFTEISSINPEALRNIKIDNINNKENFNNEINKIIGFRGKTTIQKETFEQLKLITEHFLEEEAIHKNNLLLITDSYSS